MPTKRSKVTLLVVPLLLVAGFAVFLVTKSLVAGDSAGQSSTPRGSSPANGPGTADSGTVGSGPPPGCGEVAAVDAYGNEIGRLAPLVRGIHDAACRRDYAGLLPYMENSFGGFPKEDVIAEWKREDSDGTLLRTLAETLETRAVGDQGGQYFCHPEGAVAVFARGIEARPGMWSGFELSGQERPGVCEAAG